MMRSGKNFKWGRGCFSLNALPRVLGWPPANWSHSRQKEFLQVFCTQDRSDNQSLESKEYSWL